MTVQPPDDADQASGPELVRCDNCGRYGWHETERCPEVNPDRYECAPWCVDKEGHRRDMFREDQNCWGPEHPVVLYLENKAPAAHLSFVKALEMDPPRISPYAYRGWHHLPIVYLHLYRPHENKYLDLDNNLKLTSAEARQLAANLVAAAAEIDGA